MSITDEDRAEFAAVYDVFCDLVKKGKELQVALKASRVEIAVIDEGVPQLDPGGNPAAWNRPKADKIADALVTLAAASHRLADLMNQQALALKRVNALAETLIAKAELTPIPD